MNKNTKSRKIYGRNYVPPEVKPEQDKKPKVGASAAAIMKSLGGPGAHVTHGP